MWEVDPQDGNDVETFREIDSMRPIETVYTLMKGGEPSLTTDNRDSEMLRNLITVKGGN